MTIKLKRSKEMEEFTKPLIDTRNFKGYFQVLHTYDTENGEEYRWCFYLAWFTNDDKGAHIMKWDRSYEIIPIDKHGGISIGGKYYSCLYWDH